MTPLHRRGLGEADWVLPAAAGGKGDRAPTKNKDQPPKDNKDPGVWLDKGGGKAKLSRDPMDWGIGMVGPTGNKLDPGKATETYNRLRAEKKDALGNPNMPSLRCRSV